NPAHLRDAYGITNVAGPYAGALSNGGGVVQLRGPANNLLFEVEYHTAYPWPSSPDGAGHSLVLNRPSHGPADFRSWGASARIGGSPGGLDPAPAPASTGVVINEFLAHTDDPQLDFIELFNRGGTPADLSGLVLTDDPSTNKFRFPAGTTLAARSHRALNQNELGFRLEAAGESIYLIDPAGNRVLDAFRFGPQENGVSTGRQPDGSAEFRRLAGPTPGAANATWRPAEVVINELMTSPLSHDSNDEYVELFNRTAAPVDLGDWRFTDGIDFRFPAGASLPAGGFVVVARDPARLRAHHPHLTAANTFGGYQGSLSDRGERVALAKPDTLVSTNDTGLVLTNRIWIDVAEVTYVDGGRWGRWFDAGGSSLELVDPDADPLRAASWADSDESQKATWQTYEFTGRLDNAVGDAAYGPNRFHLLMLGDGQCLVDDIEVIRSGAATN
ncbi:MAG: lamin tail domain-containing protein, partial [Verrucomicrobiota bacterium]